MIQVHILAKQRWRRSEYLDNYLKFKVVNNMIMVINIVLECTTVEIYKDKSRKKMLVVHTELQVLVLRPLKTGWRKHLQK